MLYQILLNRINVLYAHLSILLEAEAYVLLACVLFIVLDYICFFIFRAYLDFIHLRMDCFNETLYYSTCMSSLAFTASSLRVIDENLLFQTDLSCPLSFFHPLSFESFHYS